jgi:uncharacterized protein (TIGR02145 family)
MESENKIPKMFTDATLEYEKANLKKQLDEIVQQKLDALQSLHAYERMLSDGEKQLREYRAEYQAEREKIEAPYRHLHLPPMPENPAHTRNVNGMMKMQDAMRQNIVSTSNKINEYNRDFTKYSARLEEINELLKMTATQRTEKHYQLLLGTKDASSGSKEFSELAKKFREMEGYKDSEALAKECDGVAIEERRKEEERRRREEEEQRKRDEERRKREEEEQRRREEERRKREEEERRRREEERRKREEEEQRKREEEERRKKELEAEAYRKKQEQKRFLLAIMVAACVLIVAGIVVGIVIFLKNAKVIAELEKIPYGSFTDARDGKEYRTIKIGNQTWMAENLNIETPNSWCYDNNSDNCAKYGRLYTWNAAKGACPASWHLPTRQEWGVLVTFVGGERTAGAKLKAKAPNWNGKVTNGFSALPGGSRSDDRYTGGIFSSLGSGGRWWSATELDASDAWDRYMGSGYAYVGGDKYGSYKDFGFSVRCVQD